MKLKKQIKTHLQEFLFEHNSKENREKLIAELNSITEDYKFQDITDEESVKRGLFLGLGLNPVTDKCLLVAITPNNGITIYK